VFLRLAWALCWAGAFVALLGGCAQMGALPSSVPPVEERAPLGLWEGRFAVRIERTTLAETQSSQQDSAQGGFSLQSTPEATSLELNSPLGQTIAVIRSTLSLATLTLADGKKYEAATAQDLLERQLGWRLPIDRLPRALNVLSVENIPAAGKSQAIEKVLGLDWSATLAELEGDRTRVVLTWQGLSRNVTKLVLTLIIERQVGVSTNLRR
jgi:outer membrane biogenesis lipoprotein LolB